MIRQAATTLADSNLVSYPITGDTTSSTSYQLAVVVEVAGLKYLRGTALKGSRTNTLVPAVADTCE